MFATRKTACDRGNWSTTFEGEEQSSKLLYSPRSSKDLKHFFRLTELDGKHIDHLDYHEIYNPQSTSQSSAEEKEEQKKHSARQDEFILKHLFRKTG